MRYLHRILTDVPTRQARSNERGHAGSVLLGHHRQCRRILLILKEEGFFSQGANQPTAIGALLHDALKSRATPPTEVAADW